MNKHISYLISNILNKYVLYKMDKLYYEIIVFMNKEYNKLIEERNEYY